MPRAFLSRVAPLLLIGAFALALPRSGVAQPATPVDATTGVDATAVNPSESQPGVSRVKTGDGPLADALAELAGLNFATASASVDAAGLHATATVHGDASNPYATASARGFAFLVDPFVIVPRADFTGTMALLRIPYSFARSVNHSPSLAGCSSCFAAVQADLGVDGMTDLFHFLGASSQQTMNNANFFVGGVALSGILEGWVPVNTELYLRGGLLAQVHCQSNPVDSCGSEALFGGTLSFTGHSPDAVDVVWGLAPKTVTAVPEPSTWLLLLAGLGVVGRRGMLRRERREG